MNLIDTSDRIEKWLAAKVKETNAKGVVVGMSGGVDSSVAAAIARRALGGKALGLVMPCGSNAKDAERAKLLAKKFDISVQEIDLTSVFDEIRTALTATDRKALGNLKARLRMAALYYFANANNYLVLGTSNKSEIAVGYFTKYGDAACDLAPLASLYKTQVIELAKYLEIPKEIIEAAPTAGLWEGQTDEQEIGMDYATLDSILMAAEKDLPVKAGKEKVSRAKAIIKKSVHKRQMPDVCKI